jgi:hypothetical protein
MKEIGRRCSRSIQIAAIAATALLLHDAALAEGQCNFVGSSDACKNRPVSSPCALNGVAGVCVPKDRLGDSFNCECVYGQAEKSAPRCPPGLRWSAHKETCLKPQENSPDGQTHCFAPYFWDDEAHTCVQLF